METEMENGNVSQKWCFKGNELLVKSSAVSVRGVLNMVVGNLNPDDPRTVIPLGHGDPSPFPSFRTAAEAENSVSEALYSAKFNGYASTVGILPARKAVAEHLSCDLPYKLSPDDVYLTSGCAQAIEVILTVLARPNANILLPKPGFPHYEARALFSNIQIRYFDLLPEHDWEVDLDAVEALSDENTIAMVIINPGNPCGNVYKVEHLKRVAETARKLGILVISDEVYYHLTFGSNPFVPMGVFASIAPVITLGSISKRWMVPGWRLGWLVTNDPNNILKKQGIVDSIIGFLNISTDPATFVQGALSQIIEKTKADFFAKIKDMLRETAELCYSKVKEIPCITCPSRPEGGLFVMVRLNLSLLENIEDDVDFCLKLAKEESVIVLPGVALGVKNWLRITFAVEPSSLVDGLHRMKAFYERHAKKQ
ncbi:OLC1v1023900C3 [Oldenlandia corymbosa var. corymbosa]|uniref:OLC1v1023900C3 n=1 Tax=Oldenlandia corymbosa var. corymbosa TaxID=529605 RepID=A0AAV1C101_OLDCO|nr:OLC1v1023900C3 [Oldenlandia corymbosa var. corymbosa]